MPLSDLVVRIGAEISSFEASMRQVSKELRGIANEASNISGGFSRMGAQLSSVGSTLTATITAPLAGIGAAAGLAANEMDRAMHSIRVATGATGETLQGLGTTLRSVLSQVPASAGDAATAIGELNTRLGLSGEPLARMTSQMLELARLTGTEVQPLIVSTTRLFGDWSVATEKQSDTLDLLFRASQQTGVQVGELAHQLVQYGAPLRQFGLGVEEATALLSKWHQEGVNTELVLSGLRVGLSKFGGAAEPLKAAMDEIARLSQVGKDAEAAALGMEVFGKRAGIDMTRAIAEGRFAIDSLLSSLRTSSDTILRAGQDTMSFSERMTMMRNQVMLALEPLGVALLDAFNRLMPAIQSVIGVLSSAIQWFGQLPAPIQHGVIALGALVAAIGPLNLALGYVVSSIGNLGTVFAAARGAIAALAPVFTLMTTTIQGAAAAVGALNLALGGIAVAGVAAAGYAVYRLIDSYRGLRQAQDDLREANNQADASLKRLEQRYIELGGDIDKLRRDFDAGRTSAKEWWQALILATRELDAKRKAADEASKSVSRLTDAQHTGKRIANDFAAAVSGVDKNLKELHKQQQIVAEWRSISAAQQQLIALQGDIDALRAKERAAADERIRSWDQSIPVIRATRDEIKKLGSDLTIIQDGFSNLAQIPQGVATEAAKLPPVLERLANAQLEQASRVTSETTSLVNRSLQQVSTSVTDTAKRIVDILIGRSEGSVGGALRSLGEMLRTLGEGIMRNLVEPWIAAFNDLIERGIKRVVSWLLDKAGLSGALDNIREQLSGIIKSATEDIRERLTKVISPGAPGTPSAPGTGAPPVGGGGGTGRGGLSSATDWIDLATGIVDAIFSGLSFFSQRRMEQDIARIEISTRGALGQLIALQLTANDYLPYLEIAMTPLQRITELLDDAVNRVHEILREALEAVVRLGDIRSRATEIARDIAALLHLQRADAKPQQVNITVNVTTAQDEALANRIVDEIVRQLRYAGAIV